MEIFSGCSLGITIKWKSLLPEGVVPYQMGDKHIQKRVNSPAIGIIKFNFV